MLHAPVTGLYAALLTLLYLFLSYRVIARRNTAGVALGVGTDAPLQRAVRVHANLAEYAPLGLLLLLLSELSGYAPWVIHGAGLCLLAGRLVHAAGVSRATEDFRVRVAGMMLTFTALACLALLLLWAHI